jgi:hypothetical protein
MMDGSEATSDQTADDQAPPTEVPPAGTALKTALAAIARLADVKRPRAQVLHRRSAQPKACSPTCNREADQ